MKYIMDDEEAKKLIKKLLGDTLARKLEWTKEPLEKNVEVLKEHEVPLTTAHADCHYKTVIHDAAEAHFQLQGGLYYVWVSDGEDLAIARGNFFLSPVIVDDLFKLGTLLVKGNASTCSIHENVLAYLEDK